MFEQIARAQIYGFAFTRAIALAVFAAWLNSQVRVAMSDCERQEVALGLG